MEHPNEIVQYFNDRGVSVIFLLRRNLLRRLVSMLANVYDKEAKLLNGVHVSHVHSDEEVPSLNNHSNLELNLIQHSHHINMILYYFFVSLGFFTFKIQAYNQCNVSNIGFGRNGIDRFEGARLL